MGQLYDSSAVYDWNGTYDDGVAVPIGAPSKTIPAGLRVTAPAAVNAEHIAAWSGAKAGTLSVPARFAPGQAVNAEHRAEWTAPAAKAAPLRLRLDAAIARESAVRADWSRTSGHSVSGRLRLDAAAARLSSIIGMRWAGVSAREAATAILWGAALARQFPTQWPWADAARRGAYVRLRWRPGYPYETGYQLPFGGEPDPVPGSTIVIPPAEIYFMIPTLSILRDSDAEDIGAINASVRLDASSYAWTLDATIPFKNLPLVNPQTRSAPELVACFVNGYLWRFAIEAFDSNRKFGATGCRIRGRGQQALLSAKYSPRTNFTSTTNADASQLASDLMPSGWTLNWNSPDWLVKAGLFSYADAAPIDALAQLVNSIQSVIVPDQADKILTVQPLYPTSPWNFGTATPYADIPASFLTTLAGSWDGPFEDFNGINVSGMNGGVAGLVKRTGSDGTPQLPNAQPDALICHVDAARERGRIEIAKANKRKTETITALLLPAGGVDNPGVFQPGQLIKVTERAEWAPSYWLGQVVANQIDAAKSEDPNSAISVRQVLTVERFE